jgi:hypothetical protein
MLHSGVERPRLLRDALLDAVELGVNQFERLFDVPGDAAWAVAEIPDEFHREKVSARFQESQ